MDNHNLKRIRELVSDILFIDVDGISTTSSGSKIDEWDSVKHLQILLATEEAFDIRFSEEQLATIWTIESILAAVESTLQNKPD